MVRLMVIIGFRLMQMQFQNQYQDQDQAQDILDI